MSLINDPPPTPKQPGRGVINDPPSSAPPAPRGPGLINAVLRDALPPKRPPG